jgi:outer membrane protein assembly factor BamB
VAVVCTLLLAPFASGADWPAWRGPTGDGVSTEKNLPVTWSKSQSVRWKAALQGAGVSAPVVVGERVFLTASTGRLNDQLHVYCYHRADGRLLWHTRLFGTAPTDLYGPGGMAVPTPTADAKHLYVLFGTGDLACLDHAGRPVWMRSLAAEYGPFRNRWGMGTSPVLAGNMLIVQVDHWSQSYLLGVDAKTGANRWKTDRTEGVNWSSPLVLPGKDVPTVVVLGTEMARGYDPRTGKEQWSVAGLDFQCISTPVLHGDLLLLTSNIGSMAVRPNGSQGPLGKERVAWVNKRAKAFIPSALAYQGQLYVPADQGFAICLDAATGQQLWKERLGEQYHASPVAGDGKIYFASKEGIVRVLRAGPTFELLAANDMGETIIASPAIAGGDIFLRGEKHLFCIGNGNR